MSRRREVLEVLRGHEAKLQADLDNLAELETIIGGFVRDLRAAMQAGLNIISNERAMAEAMAAVEDGHGGEVVN